MSDGTFTWGVKETFRAYISGTIANGSWSESDGASYETPSFRWGSGTGSIDPETGTGTVSFTGRIHFTGHDGVLDLTFANPTLEFEGDGKASLLLDSRSTNAQGEVVVDTQQEWVGDVEVKDGLPVSGGKIVVEGLPTTLTNSGAKAFAGFYQPDIPLDPIGYELTVPDCGDAAGGSAQPESGKPSAAADDAGAAPAQQAGNEVPWLPIGIGGAALLVIGLTGGILIGGARRARTAPTAVGGAEATGTQQTPQN